MANIITDKRISRFGMFILSLFLVSCYPEEEKVLEFSGKIIQNTCGGTVIEVFSNEVGEKWINFFGDQEAYENVVLSDLELEGEFQLKDLISFNYKEVEFFKGNFCDIGGLPEKKIEITGVEKKRTTHSY